MQQTSLCTACGAEMLDEARFCRKCGKPSARFPTDSVTEGTTRILEAPEANKVLGQEFYEQHGSLAQPTTPIPPQANPTARNLAAEPKRQNWMLIGSLIFVGCALIATILFFALRGSSTAATPIVIKKQMPPMQPPHPPPLPPVTAQPTDVISADFIYPGSEKLMEVTDANEGNVLQLRTSDPFDKVVSWYTEKLKPTNVVKSAGGNVVLNSDEMTAVINNGGGGGGVTILLHQGGD